MNLGLKKILNVSLPAILAIVVVFVLYRIVKADYSVEVPADKECPPDKSAGILRFIKQTDTANVVPPSRINHSLIQLLFATFGAFEVI